MSKRDRKNVLSFSRSLIVPNVTLNKSETFERKKKAREAFSEIKISIEENQTIISSGTIVDSNHIAILDEIKKIKSQRNLGFLSVIAALLMTAILLGFSSYNKRFAKLVFSRKDLILLSFMSIFSALLMKGFWILSGLTFLEKNPFLTQDFFYYLAPLSFASMALGVLISSAEVVWLFTFFMSFLYSMAFNFNMLFFVYTLLGGLVAVRYVYFCNKRSDIYWTGLRVGFINVFILFIFLSWKSWGMESFWETFLWQACAGFAGGVASSLVTMMIVPLLENIFNYTTDIKLLELSNLNHPLLQNLVVRAPGTYHHSLIVGSMAESAAKKIGCNPLLSKVMAYYHDIGKAEHAEYFIENQRPGHNPHDHISPFMSRTILVAHVKDGAEMALEHNLGRPIIDGILQHHGTSSISFFYNKALSEESEGKSVVNEDDFRYPGPKPQFREAALVMLADSIEAAARSLNDPTVSRLQNIVHTIIREKFLEGQLDECDLTLKDISIIEEAFEHVILGVHHQRIEYPGPV